MTGNGGGGDPATVGDYSYSNVSGPVGPHGVNGSGLGWADYVS